MQTVEFKGKKWTIDLDWEILPGDSTVKEESKEIAIKTNCNYGVLIDYDSQFAIGLAKKNTKIPSASLYLALANQEARAEEGGLSDYSDWIVVEEMGDDKYWMAVIKSGVPSPQYDKVFDITTIRDKISELLINDTYHLFSPCGEIKSIFEDMKYVEEKTLNELTENVVSKIKFTKLRGIPNNVVYGGIALMILLGLGLGVSSFMDSYTLKQRAAALQKQQQEEQQRAQEEYKQKMAIYNKQIADLTKQAQDNVVLGLSGTPSKVLNAWYDAVGGIDFGTHGCKIEEIDCQFTPASADKSTCTINFSRNGLATNRMLLQDYPDAVLQGDKASVVRKVLVNDSIFAKPADDILNTLPDAKNWGFDMISQLQLLKIANIDHEIKASTDITITPPPKPLSPQEMATGTKPSSPTPIPIGIAQGDVTVKSDNFALLRELADNVDFKAVGVKSVKFTLGEIGAINWEVTLNYYVKTTNGTIAASNSATLSNSAVADKNANQQGKPIWQTMGKTN